MHEKYQGSCTIHTLLSSTIKPKKAAIKNDQKSQTSIKNGALFKQSSKLWQFEKCQRSYSLK